jgi:hypothetical protein
VPRGAGLRIVVPILPVCRPHLYGTSAPHINPSVVRFPARENKGMHLTVADDGEPQIAI